MVVELMIPELNTWWSFMADRIPEALDDAIKAHKLAFIEAQKLLTAQEIMDQLPVVFPSTHIVDPKLLPGVSRFPIDDWKAAGEPSLTVSGWAALAMKIASKDLTGLASVFAVAEQIHKKTPSEASGSTDKSWTIIGSLAGVTQELDQPVVSQLGPRLLLQHVVSQLAQLEPVPPRMPPPPPPCRRKAKSVGSDN